MAQQFWDNIQDLFGNALPASVVTVLNYPNGSLASLFQDYGLTVPQANPFTLSSITGATGIAPFFADNGTYTVKVQWHGIAEPYARICTLYDPAIDPNVQTPPLSNVAALRQLILFVVSPAVYVEGYFVPGDGGGGQFVYVSTDHSSSDNGVTIFVDAAGRRWHRQYSGPIALAWGGVVGDGATNDTAAIQKVIDVAASLAVTGGRYVSVTSLPGITMRVAVAGSYTTSGGAVTERYAVLMRQGVSLELNGAQFIYTGSGTDTATNQFHMLVIYEPALAAYDTALVSGGTFNNTGTFGSYVNGFTVFTGDSSKAARWMRNISAANLTGINLRVLHKVYSDRADGVFTLFGYSATGLNTISASSAVAVYVNVESGNVSGVFADSSGFDVLDILGVKDFNVSNVTAASISQFVLNITCLGASNTIQNLNVSNVSSDSGMVNVYTDALSSAGFIDGVTLSNIQIPNFEINNSAGGSTVSRVRASGIVVKCGTGSRGITIAKTTDCFISAAVNGSPTLSGAFLQNSDRLQANLQINLSSAVHCVEMDRNRESNSSIQAIGGSVALYLTGSIGTMGGAFVNLVCTGQSASAIDGDGTTSISHRVQVAGNYNSQTIPYVPAKGSFVALQVGWGADLTIASSALAAVFNDSHVVLPSTGTADNLQSITAGGLLGRRVTLFASGSNVITVKHATGGGNIRTLSGADFTVNAIIGVVLEFNAAGLWCQV